MLLAVRLNRASSCKPFIIYHHCVYCISLGGNLDPQAAVTFLEMVTKVIKSFIVLTDPGDQSNIIQSKNPRHGSYPSLCEHIRSAAHHNDSSL